MRVAFVLNGVPTEVDCPPDTRVIDLLRGELGLTGTKEGCGIGECGACSIHVDGRLKLACLMIAAQLPGRRVTTIEGIASAAGGLHPLQEAFIDSGAVQCGFCTPGMIMAGLELLARCPDADREQVRRGLSGNLCRCTGYQKIVDGVLALVPPPGPPEPEKEDR